MNLKDIFKEILDIASDIENNNLSYRLRPLVTAGKRNNPADLLTGIAARFLSDITYDLTPCKQKTESALKDLKKIAKDYDIKELGKPIKNLESYLDRSG